MFIFSLLEFWLPPRGPRSRTDRSESHMHITMSVNTCIIPNTWRRSVDERYTVTVKQLAYLLHALGRMRACIKTRLSSKSIKLAFEDPVSRSTGVSDRVQHNASKYIIEKMEAFSWLTAVYCTCVGRFEHLLIDLTRVRKTRCLSLCPTRPSQYHSSCERHQ